jgi:hypothetical protein
MSGYLKIPIASEGGGSAEDTTFDPSGTGLSSTNVQDAIIEVYESISIPASYSQSFNATTDWTLDVDYYRINVPVATHNKGASPNCKVYENITSVFYLTFPSISMDSSGNLFIQVTSNPDNRFAGKLIVQ